MRTGSLQAPHRWPLAVGSPADAALSWMDEDGATLSTTQYAPSGWREAQPLSTGSLDSGGPTTAFDVTGALRVLWSESSAEGAVLQRVGEQVARHLREPGLAAQVR